MVAHTEHEIVIDAPLELVWDMTNDIESWPRLFSEYSEATVLDRSGDAVRFRLALHPDENGKVWSWVSERRPDRATWTVRSQRVETGPFKYMWIYWEYLREGTGVRLRWVQDFEMKPQAPVSDAEMKARLDRNTPVQQRLVKEKVEAAARAAVG
nr:cyclase [uncultured bacterium]